MSEPEGLPDARHEHRDIGFRFGVFWFGGILACLGLVLGFVLIAYPTARLDRRLALPLPRYPDPVLQTSPRADMAQFLAAELAWLNGLGWVAREEGRVHIPIEAAMRQVAARGIAGWPTVAPATPPPAGPGR